MRVQSQTFREFKRCFRWEQGEHVSFIGPTGRGKTTLALSLLNTRTYRVIFATKPEDEALDTFARKNRYKTIPKWKDRGTKASLILKPALKDVDAHKSQASEFKGAINTIYQAGGWTVFVDEVYYFTHMLRIEKPLEMLWSQGRSIGITMVAGTQRPRSVPLMMFNQATHLFVFKFADAYEVERLAEIGSVPKRTLIEAVTQLTKHRFLYINAIEGTMVQSEVDV